MIILRLAPVAVGVVLVIDLTLAVLLLKALFHGLLRLAVALTHTRSAVLQIGVNEDMQAVGPVLQNVVGAAAHDHARPLVGKVADNIRLADIELVRDGHCIDQAHGMGRNGDVEQEAARDGGVLADLLDEFVGEATLLCNGIHKLLIVVGDAEPLGHGLSDGASATAEHTADGDDFVGHVITPSYHIVISAG